MDIKSWLENNRSRIIFQKMNIEELGLNLIKITPKEEAPNYSFTFGKDETDGHILLEIPSALGEGDDFIYNPNKAWLASVVSDIRGNYLLDFSDSAEIADASAAQSVCYAISRVFDKALEVKEAVEDALSATSDNNLVNMGVKGVAVPYVSDVDSGEIKYTWLEGNFEETNAESFAEALVDQEVEKILNAFSEVYAIAEDFFISLEEEESMAQRRDD